VVTAQACERGLTLLTGRPKPNTTDMKPTRKLVPNASELLGTYRLPERVSMKMFKIREQCYRPNVKSEGRRARITDAAC
jgi:hypothetical protein